MEPSIAFSPIGTADIPALRALAGRIWREYYPAIISVGQIEYMLEKMYGETALREEIAEGWVYEWVWAEGNPAGFLAYRHESAEKKVKLAKLYLEAHWRGRGIGRAMLAHVRDAAAKSGALEIHLCVNKRNARAMAAYRVFGFVMGEAVVADIGGGFVMDDYIMRFTVSV